MTLHYRKTITLVALAIGMIFGGTQTEAFYTSVKSLGMGGAVAAHPLDSLVAAYNPAGQAFVGNRWDLGLHWAKEWGNAKFSGNDLVGGTFDSHHSWDNLFIPEFGVTKYICECEFTWGFVIYNRSFYKTSFKFANPIFGTSKPGLEYLHYVAAPTGTLTIGCNHALGITIDFHGQRLKVEGLENFANDFFSDEPNRVTNKGYDYSGGVGVTVGWMSKVSDCVSLGAAYSPQVEMSRFSDYKGLVARKGRVNIPQRVLGGVAIEMLCDLTATFDIEHIKYNHISPLEHSLLPNLLDDLLGEDRGAGLGWRDQTIFRFGLNWEIDEIYSVRVGYWYQRSPIKASETLANTLVPNLTQRVITWGGTWKFTPCDEFSFYGAYAFQNNISGRDSIPDFLGGGEASLKERKWLAGFTWGKFF